MARKTQAAEEPMTQAPDDLMDTEETAELLKTTPNGLYVLNAKAKRESTPELAPPAYKIGTRLLFSKSEVLRWLAERQDDPKVPA